MKIDEIITEKCWQGYKQVGMKKKGDRMVPNCVPINDDMDFEDMDTPKCEEGHYYCRESKMCKPIPQGYTLRQDGYLIKDNEQLDVITLEDDQDFHEYYGYPGYVEEDGVWEAEYRGRKVKLGKEEKCKSGEFDRIGIISTEFVVFLTDFDESSSEFHECSDWNRQWQEA